MRYLVRIFNVVLLGGTLNFAHGYLLFAVSIGIKKKGKTLAGVFYDIMHDVIFSAKREAVLMRIVRE